MLRKEVLSSGGGKTCLFVETQGSGVPLPSNRHISATFTSMVPGAVVELSSRDDERNSIVMTLPDHIPVGVLDEFLSRLERMTAC